MLCVCKNWRPNLWMASRPLNIIPTILIPSVLSRPYYYHHHHHHHHSYYRPYYHHHHHHHHHGDFIGIPGVGGVLVR